MACTTTQYVHADNCLGFFLWHPDLWALLQFGRAAQGKRRSLNKKMYLTLGHSISSLVVPHDRFLLLFLQVRIRRITFHGTDGKIPRHREIKPRMVGHHYCSCLIKRGFPPTNLTMLDSTDAVNDSSVFRLEMKLFDPSTIKSTRPVGDQPSFSC